MDKIKVGILTLLACTYVSVTALPLLAHGELEHTKSSSKATAKRDAIEKALASQLWFKPKLQSRIPLDISFTDEEGNTDLLTHYFDKKPVILVLLYYSCATMCIAEMETLESSLKEINLSVGREFDVVAVSIDPRETPAIAAEAKQKYAARYGRPATEKGWHFLTGNRNSIRSLSKAIGFGYAYNAATREYLHPNGILVLTPEGRISQFFSGFDYPPFDLRLSLIAASPDAHVTPMDRVAFFSMVSDPDTGKYHFNAPRLFGGALLFGILPIGLLLRRTRRRSQIERLKGMPNVPAVERMTKERRAK